MAYRITFPLPDGWKSRVETLPEMDGMEISHLEAYLPNDVRQSDDAEIDICVGPMPEDTTAQDEALANYADVVGWDDDDPEDFDPLTEWPFQHRKAYGFEALCEDDSPMRVMCVEIRKGVLVVMTLVGKDDDELTGVIQYVESHLRIG